LLLLLTGATGAAAGCGGDDFENKPRPATAVTLTGVIQDEGVTVSPKEEGAGPVVITISNQTDQSRSVTLEGEDIEETIPPVNPQDTGTIQATLKPGTYEVRAGSPKAVAREIPPAELTIGSDRDSSSDELLVP
jgi:hypothetical protein